MRILVPPLKYVDENVSGYNVITVYNICKKKKNRWLQSTLQYQLAELLPNTLVFFRSKVSLNLADINQNIELIRVLFN